MYIYTYIYIYIYNFRVRTWGKTLGDISCNWRIILAFLKLFALLIYLGPQSCKTGSRNQMNSSNKDKNFELNNTMTFQIQIQCSKILQGSKEEHTYINA